MTHEPDIAEHCSRVVVFRDGRAAGRSHGRRARLGRGALAEAAAERRRGRMSQVLERPTRRADSPTLPTPPSRSRRPDAFALLATDAAARRSGRLAVSLPSALEALRANKGRAILTTLGIIIGVGAVIVMVALGQGASAQVSAACRASAPTC